MNAQFNESWSCLCFFVSQQLQQVALQLLSGGAYANAKQEDGMTPLHHASRAGTLQTARALLDAGADANAVSRLDGWTALHYAQERGEQPWCYCVSRCFGHPICVLRSTSK